ncbi:MAG TPA: tetratricopeptide repeat protein [Chthoniobacterales bacterium]|nr:tetratricopeptide repeat protein [Chthoniobacterales bacterium]
MSGFFEEIKRRKVYRVAIAYILAGWALAQGLAQLLPVFDIPNSVIRIVIALMLIGFPITLVLAWAFDITPQGIKATPASPTGTHRRRNLALLGATGVVISAAAGFFLLPPAAAHKVDKSIAVLPFDNLTKDEENAFFADGIQDDILTNLSKIGDLKVISRTSVMSYRGKTANVREIGKALGVSTILEGSVRREGNKVRVNVQLINTANDEHIWASNYDRDLTNVFATQTDLAREIANALRAKLSPSEKAQLEKTLTWNDEALAVFKRAHELMTRPDKLRDDAMQAQDLLVEATRLDPNFAAAYAQLGYLAAWIYHSHEPTTEQKDKSRLAIDTAQRLDPNCPDNHLARGFYYYYCDSDDQHYQRALNELSIAQKGSPNEPQIYLAIGAIQRRQGNWEESTANLEKAAALDPQNSWVLQNLAFNYMATKDYQRAEEVVDKGIAIAPEALGLRGAKAKIAIVSRGDFSVGEQLLAMAPPSMDRSGLLTFGRISLLMGQRKFQEALAVIQSVPSEMLHTDGTVSMPKALMEGNCYKLLKEDEKARVAYEKALPLVQKMVQEAPEDPSRHAMLGELLAMLGRKEEAIQEGKRAMELKPESKDAFDGPAFTTSMAQIYTWVGERDQALQLIEKLLDTPNGLTAPILKIDPVWDPLRDDPRFQALINRYAKA